MVRAFLNIYNSVFEMGHLRHVVNKAFAFINSILRYIYDQNRVRYLKNMLISYRYLFKWGCYTVYKWYDQKRGFPLTDCMSALANESFLNWQLLIKFKRRGGSVEDLHFDKSFYFHSFIPQINPLYQECCARHMQHMNVSHS